MRIYFATCAEKLSGTEDDHLFANLLIKSDHVVLFKDWMDDEVKWEEADLVIIRSTWNYQRHFEKFLLWIKKLESKTTILNSSEVIRWNASKVYLKELQNMGYPIVPTVFTSDFETGVKACKMAMVKGEIIIKPAISASADLTYRVTDEKFLPSLVAKILERGELLIQPYLNSIETDGEVSLIYFNKKYSHALVKTPMAGDFRVQSEFGGGVERFTPSEALIQIGENALKDLPFNLFYARVDLVEWKSNPMIGEIELIEPELFFRCSEDSVQNALSALVTYK